MESDSIVGNGNVMERSEQMKSIDIALRHHNELIK